MRSDCDYTLTRYSITAISVCSIVTKSDVGDYFDAILL